MIDDIIGSIQLQFRLKSRAAERTETEEAEADEARKNRERNVGILVFQGDVLHLCAEDKRALSNQ
jgi:hypothetical protein